MMQRNAVVVVMMMMLMMCGCVVEAKVSDIRSFLECMTCAYSIQEIEGFLEENYTAAQIVQYVETTFCARLAPSAQGLVCLPLLQHYE